MKPATDGRVEIASSTALRSIPEFSLLPQALRRRMGGPGGLYNTGNFLGLAVGIAVQMENAADGGAARALAVYLAGNVSALMLTLATLIFFVSGEAYHRAWQNGFPPDKGLNRLGDFLSAIGALALGAALFALGHPVLAATAGLMHAAGKFGSTMCTREAGQGVNWPWIFRASVLASRLPAMLAALIELAGHVPVLAQGEPVLPALMPATLLVCYLLWAKADLILFRH
jgi:hypothetical protein